MHKYWMKSMNGHMFERGTCWQSSFSQKL